MTDSGPTLRRISIVAFAIWLVLIAVQYDYVPGLRAAWGFHLLRYQPSWLGWLLAGLALLVTTEEMRRGLLSLARGAARRLGGLSESRRDVLLFALAFAAFWLLRERHLFGVSKPLLLLLGADEPATKVPLGAEMLLRAILRGAGSLGLPAAGAARLTSCVFGASALVLLTRAARAVGGGSRSSLIPLLVFSGGLLRVCVGRIDLQPPVVTAGCAALLLSLQEIRAGGRLRAAALAVGISAWLQPVCLSLLPGLLLVAALPERVHSPRHRLRRLGAALGWALVPLLVHAAGMVLWSIRSDSSPADTVAASAEVKGWVASLAEVAGLRASLSLPSARHAAYLVNAGFVLAPAALPILLAFAVGAGRRRLYAEPIARFLALSCVSLLLGACWARLGFGAYEWDKLAVSGLFLAFFAAHLLSGVHGDAVRGQLAAALVGMQFLFVGLPLLCLSFGSSADAGPFSKDAFSQWSPAGTAPSELPDAEQP